MMNEMWSILNNTSIGRSWARKPVPDVFYYLASMHVILGLLILLKLENS